MEKIMTVMGASMKAPVIYVVTAGMTLMSSVMVRIMIVMGVSMRVETSSAPKDSSVRLESAGHRAVEMCLAVTNVHWVISVKKIPASVTALASTVLKGRSVSLRLDHVVTYARM